MDPDEDYDMASLDDDIVKREQPPLVDDGLRDGPLTWRDLSVSTSIRSNRDHTFVKRFLQTVGYNQAIHDDFVQYAANWYDSLFWVDEAKLRKLVCDGLHTPTDGRSLGECDVPTKLKQAPPQEGTRLDFDVVKGSGVTNYNLQPHDLVSLKGPTDRNALAINTGGPVTSLKWSSNSLLCVSVIKGANLEDLVNAPDLSVFSTAGAKNFKTAIQVWRYADNQAVLYEEIDTTAIGTTSDISWADSEGPGVLIGTFTDGHVHLIRLGEHEDGIHLEYVSSLSYLVRDESDAVVPILAYAILGTNRLIVGTVDGSIAEFILPNHPEADDLAIPSFKQRVCDTTITAVSVAEPEPANHLIFVQTTDNESYLIQYRNQLIRIPRGMALATVAPKYHHQLRVFLMLESADALGFVHVRCPQERQIMVLKTELITSFAISERLGHPLALVGDHLGDVYVVNFARKLVAKGKVGNKSLVPLRLWSVSHDKKLTLTSDYAQVAPEKPNPQQLFAPCALAVSATAWNESLDASSAYAVGTIAGLVVIERLDPNV